MGKAWRRWHMSLAAQGESEPPENYSTGAGFHWDCCCNGPVRHLISHLGSRLSTLVPHVRQSIASQSFSLRDDFRDVWELLIYCIPGTVCTWILYRGGIFQNSIWADGTNKNVSVAGYHYSVPECLSAQSVSASKGALKRCPLKVNYRQILDGTPLWLLCLGPRRSQNANFIFHFIPPLQTGTVAVGGVLRLSVEKLEWSEASSLESQVENNVWRGGLCSPAVFRGGSSCVRAEPTKIKG